MTGLPVSVAVETVEPPDLFEWFERFREQLGFQVVAVGPGAAATLLRALKEKHVVCLLSDRLVGQASGVEVSFFGEGAMLPAGPATLALRSGAPVLPGAIYFGKGASSHRVVFRPPIELPTGLGFRQTVARGHPVHCQRAGAPDPPGADAVALATAQLARGSLAAQSLRMGATGGPGADVARGTPNDLGSPTDTGLPSDPGLQSDREAGVRAGRPGLPVQPEHPGRGAGTGARHREGAAFHGSGGPRARPLRWAAARAMGFSARCFGPGGG